MIPSGVAVAVDAVLFDYGLVLTGPPAPAAWAEMLAVTGLAPEQFEAAYWAPRLDYDRGVHSGAAYWRAAGRHVGVELEEGQIARLIAADNALWTQPNQPMIDWAARLQRAGMRTGILSNLGDAMTAGVLAACPWVAGFDHCTWSHTLGMAKPELAIYRHAAAALGVPAERILFVDDRADNLAGASAAGLQTVRYTTQDEFEGALRAMGLEELWRRGRVTVPHSHFSTV